MDEALDLPDGIIEAEVILRNLALLDLELERGGNCHSNIVLGLCRGHNVELPHLVWIWFCLVFWFSKFGVWCLVFAVCCLDYF